MCSKSVANVCGECVRIYICICVYAFACMCDVCICFVHICIRVWDTVCVKFLTCKNKRSDKYRHWVTGRAESNGSADH